MRPLTSPVDKPVLLGQRNDLLIDDARICRNGSVGGSFTAKVGPCNALQALDVFVWTLYVQLREA